ncbi:hypothetical protein ACOMHN_060170 [Nucella lapillus]
MKCNITASGDPGNTSAYLHAVKFHDKTVVTPLSTRSTGRLVVNSGRKTKTTPNQPMMIPEAVHMYNSNMRGVDQFNLGLLLLQQEDLEVVEEGLFSLNSAWPKSRPT